jgi:hypothetical protein
VLSAENRKNRENNKREQARPKKISHLAKGSGFISQLVIHERQMARSSRWVRQIKKPGAVFARASYNFSRLRFLA